MLSVAKMLNILVLYLGSVLNYIGTFLFRIHLISMKVCMIFLIRNSKKTVGILQKF